MDLKYFFQRWNIQLAEFFHVSQFRKSFGLLFLMPQRMSQLIFMQNGMGKKKSLKTTSHYYGVSIRRKGAQLLSEQDTDLPVFLFLQDLGSSMEFY